MQAHLGNKNKRIVVCCGVLGEVAAATIEVRDARLYFELSPRRRQLGDASVQSAASV